jgi:NADH-quinone oxidoreductase subunit G
MPTFKLDGKTIPFEPGETIIRAAYKQGIEIPHYCWHPGLSAPANCRMCLVEIAPPPGQRPLMLDIVEWDAKAEEYKPVQKPKLQPACQFAAADGMVVQADSSEHVQEARRAVQELLLLNHPVDCPICDQAGECKLQDYWLEYQHSQKRMRDEPVHKPKAVVFGPTIVYDAERCVMCTRCIRFMDEVAKDPVLDMRERGNLNEIAVAPGRQLDGHYTFMTEHVCPVGALTTQDFRFKARVWFLRTVDSICQGCATGCNAYLDYDPRYGKVQRYRPRDNEQVNKYWMCDEGMLSYHGAHQRRVLEPEVGGRATTLVGALEAAKKLFEGVPRESIAVVLSAEHSLEDNWALRELATVLLGTKNIYIAGRPPGYEDKILIHKDKNANTAGVRDLVAGARPFPAFVDDIVKGGVTHAIALGGVAAAPAPLGAREGDVDKLKSLRALVVIAVHDGPLAKAAHVLLPAASWAEASGTFVNAKGLRQQAEKAIPPQGSSKPAWELVALVAKALGLDASWTKLREIRARLLASDGGGGTPSSPPQHSPDAGRTPHTTESV